MPVALSPADAPLVLAALLFGWAAIEDVRHLRIPNWIPVCLCLVYFGHALTTTNMINISAAIIVGGGLLIAGIICFSLGWLGGGDGKLIAAAGLFAGPTQLADFALVTTLAGAGMALLFLSPVRPALAWFAQQTHASHLSETLSGSRLPYAVAIAVGACVVLANSTQA